jgi:protein dithiol:quinone oxidoreductase
MVGRAVPTQQSWLHGLRHNPVVLLLATAGLSLLAVAVALFSQHQWKMQPCPWCILQRMLFLLLAATALLGLATRGWGRRISAAALLVLSACGAAAAAWQHWVAAATASCKLTLADRIISSTGLDSWWPQVFAVFASCAEAKTTLLGVPYEFYSLALFAVLAALAWLVLRSR